MRVSVEDSSRSRSTANAEPAARTGGGDSARRVLDLLQAFTKHRHTLSTRALAEATGIPLPTVYRYVAFLREEGFLVDRGKAGYSLSARVVSLAQAAQAADSLIEIADATMRRLSDETSETVILVRAIGHSAVCVHRIESQHYLRISFEPGQPVRLEGGASARLLLASLPPAERRRALADLYERDPERAAWIEREAVLAGERGWAVSQEEIHRGVFAASAAIRDEGRTIACLTIPSPLVRAPAELHDELIERVRAAAAEITVALRARREAG